DLSPGASRFVKPRALASLTFLADGLAYTLQLLRHLLICGNNLVEGVRNLAFQTGPRARQAHGKIAVPHGLKASENYSQTGAFRRGYLATVGWSCMRRLFLSCSRESIRASFHVCRLDTSKTFEVHKQGASLSPSLDRVQLPPSGRPIIESERNS